MTTTFLKSLSLRTNSTTSSALLGLLVGAAAAVVVCLASWLSPLSAGDRPTLALLGVTLSLPLGCLLARTPNGLREASAIGISSVVATLVFTGVLVGFEPALWLRTASWCVAGGLIGSSIASMAAGAGVVLTCFWLALNGLPFFYSRIPVFADVAELWALQGCPWLGFSSDAFGGDPLRRPVLYLGQWTELTGTTSLGLLRVSTLWVAAVPGFASLLVSAVAFHKPSPEPEPVAA